MGSGVSGQLILSYLFAAFAFGVLVSGTQAQTHPQTRTDDPTDVASREVRMRLGRESESVPPRSPIASAATISAHDLGVPPNARKQFEKGRKLLLEAHRSLDSVVYFRKATELAPRFSEAHFLLGVAYIDVGQYSEAEAWLINAASIDAKNGRAYLALGYSLIEQGKYGESERPLSQGLEIEPESSFGHYDLARTYYALNRFAEAEEQARKAISLAPDFGAMHALLANALLRTDPAGALHEFEEALRLDPFDPSTAHIEDIVKRLKTTTMAAAPNQQ